MSRPVDLHGSLHRALYHPEKFERLELLGLPINVLMSVGLGRVRADGDGLFVFDDDGVEALIGAVMPGDEPVDLFALPVANPNRCRRLLGIGDLLGEANLIALSFTGEPVRVHHRPIECLAAGGDGICILEWRPSTAGLLSTIRGGLVIDDPTFGIDLRRRLAGAGKVDLPPIFVADDTEEAA